MDQIPALVIAGASLAVSVTTAWLTLWRRGTVRMTRPTVFAFAFDGSDGTAPKVFLRCLLYSTARRGRVVESMWLRLRRGETSQVFNVWVYGDSTPSLARGSGVFAGPEGIACNHHFLLPRDGTTFEFLPGDYVVEVFASLVGEPSAMLMAREHFALSESHAKEMKEKTAAAYFDWGPDSRRYHCHIDDRPKLGKADRG